jgi:hypothetical protein
MTKYQIALFSNGADVLINTLRETLKTRLEELGVAQDFVSFFDESTIASRDPKAPTVGAFVSVVRNPGPRPEIERLAAC